MRGSCVFHRVVSRKRGGCRHNGRNLLEAALGLPHLALFLLVWVLSPSSDFLFGVFWFPEQKLLRLFFFLLSSLHLLSVVVIFLFPDKS